MVAVARVVALSLAVLAWAGCATTRVDPVDVTWYRYGLDLRSGDTRYVEPLDAAVVDGRRYRVERDTRGRIIRVATFIGADKVAEVAYRFAGVGRWSVGYEYWTADGEPTTRVRILRDEQGRRIRQEYLRLDGQLTSYRLRAYYADGHVSLWQYTATDRLEQTTTLFYSDQDVLTRSRRVPGSDQDVVTRLRRGPGVPGRSAARYDAELDEQTGLMKETRKYQGEVLQSVLRPTYDAGGLLSRLQHHDARGRRYATSEYNAGLKTALRQDLGDGSVLEVRFAYDAKRWTRESRYVLDGRHIFTLAYERHPNGHVARSVARGPDGTIWAEYPDLYVEYVEPTGEAVDRPGVAKIYRKGPWWPGPGGLRVERIAR